MQKNETQSPTYTIQKINSRWIKDLNISHDIVKSFRKTVRKISNITSTNIFTDMSPKARGIKERINKWDLIKQKASAWLKKTALK